MATLAGGAAERQAASGYALRALPLGDGLTPLPGTSTGVMAYPAIADVLTPGVVVIGRSADVLEALSLSGPGVRSFYGTVGNLSYGLGDTIGSSVNYLWANVVRLRGDLVIDVSVNYESAVINMERIVMQLKNIGQ